MAGKQKPQILEVRSEQRPWASEGQGGGHHDRVGRQSGMLALKGHRRPRLVRALAHLRSDTDEPDRLRVPTDCNIMRGTVGDLSQR